MYESQIQEIKNQEQHINYVISRHPDSYLTVFAWDQDKGKTGEQLKAEHLEIEKEYYNKLLRNLGELVAFGPANNQGI